MKPGGFSCQDITERASDYLDQEMTWREWMGFRLHLMTCGPCRAYLRQMRMTLRVLTTLPHEPLPDEVADELMQMYRAWKAEGDDAS